MTAKSWNSGAMKCEHCRAADNKHGFQATEMGTTIKNLLGTARPQNLCLISLLSTTGKQFENLIFRTIQRHIEKTNLLNASRFGFSAYNSAAFKLMRLTEDITLNVDGNDIVGHRESL
jgi:hypothetical protein